MGEAKRNAERLRVKFLAEIDQWMFPPTEWEARTVAEVQRLPSHTIRRLTQAEQVASGMPARECHANCTWYQDNDPERKSRQVSGWLHQEGGYTLHSVVARDGGMIDITPSLIDLSPTIEFTPDAKIEWRDEGDFRVPYREGHVIGPGLRLDPAAALADLQMMKDRLLSGMNPWKAVQKEEP